MYRSANGRQRFLMTQLPSLDRVLLGGLPRATITEVSGFESLRCTFHPLMGACLRSLSRAGVARMLHL